MTPASVFCTILEKEYLLTIENIENTLFLPVRAARSIQNNISMVENSIYPTLVNQVDNIESSIFNVSNLDQVNQLEDNGYCQLAYQCHALVHTLVSQSATYLPFLSHDIVSQLSSSYSVFEKNICIIGMTKLIQNATDGLLAQYANQLRQLLTRMTDALRLDELIAKYQQILDESGILSYLDTLKEFIHCATGICNFAASSSNAIDDYLKKLCLDTNYDVDTFKLLQGFDKKNDEMTARIQKLIQLCENRNFPQGIARDKLMTK